MLVVFHVSIFLSSYNLFTFSIFHFCFPVIPKDQSLRGSWPNIPHWYINDYESFVNSNWRKEIAIEVVSISWNAVPS